MVTVPTENSQVVALETSFTRDFKGLETVNGVVSATLSQSIMRMKPYLVGLESGKVTLQPQIEINPMGLTETTRNNLFGIEQAIVDAFEEYYTPEYAERVALL